MDEKEYVDPEGKMWHTCGDDPPHKDSVMALAMALLTEAHGCTDDWVPIFMTPNGRKYKFERVFGATGDQEEVLVTLVPIDDDQALKFQAGNYLGEGF